MASFHLPYKVHIGEGQLKAKEPRIGWAESRIDDHNGNGTAKRARRLEEKERRADRKGRLRKTAGAVVEEGEEVDVEEEVAEEEECKEGGGHFGVLQEADNSGMLDPELGGRSG